MSLWDLGEGSGYEGRDLALHRIACAFCLEEGNFTEASEHTKKNPRTGKTLHFTTLKCGNCAGYVMVLWSAGASHGRLHDFRVLPSPQRVVRAPEEWPNDVGRYWVQAHRSLSDENWDAAAVMARSSLQIAFRDKGATGKNLKEEINDLVSRGVMSPTMGEWSHEVRELGNDSAHPRPGQVPTASKDAHDIVCFLDYCLEYLYPLPQHITRYR